MKNVWFIENTFFIQSLLSYRENILIQVYKYTRYKCLILVFVHCKKNLPLSILHKL